MATVFLRWRFFWSRRSRWRTMAALVFALLALLATAYLALPSDGRHQVANGFARIIQGIGSFGPDPALEVGLVVCLILSLALIVIPSYRRHHYLTTMPSIVPPVSVYLDAENQLSEGSVRPFTDFLIKHLDGRRADLLYFLDASQTAKGDKYKTLYRFGFRPVDVPHDPTGQGAVKEAVDRELAMHAYERAILGPPEQEFIIVTGDADFVPLIYRLVALGHQVQIWASPIREAYRVVETYLGVNVIDLGEVVAELAAAPAQNEPETAPKPNTRRKRKSRGDARLPRISMSAARLPVPASLTSPGEDKLYLAIAKTLEAHAASMRQSRDDSKRSDAFRRVLSGELGPHLSGVGYGAGGSRIEYWIDHLLALNILEATQGHEFPKRGTAMEEDAARRLFAMARLAARATTEAASTHADDSSISTHEAANALDSMSADADEMVAPLIRLVSPTNKKRTTHTRYFVRCARALGLLGFEDVPHKPDMMGHVHLPESVFTSETSMPQDQETAADEADEAVIMYAEPTGGDAHSDDASVVLDVTTPVIAETQEADTRGEAAGEFL